MLYTMMLALPPTGAGVVALASVAFVVFVSVALVPGLALAFGPGVQPVSASTPASTAAAGADPARNTRFLSMTVLFRQGQRSGVAGAEQQRAEDEQDHRVAAEHGELAPGREHVRGRLTLGAGD